METWKRIQDCMPDWRQQQATEQRRQETEMGRYAKATGGDFVQAPLGNHIARCYQIIDIGTQHSEYQGESRLRNQVILGFELCNEKMENGEPFVISRFYTNSLSEKATMRHHLELWRGRAFTQEELDGFDLGTIVGAPCMLSVIANDKGKSVVGGIAAIPKGMKCPPLVNAPFTFFLDEFERKKFESISEGLRKMIEKSEEYRAMVSPLAKTAGTLAADAVLRDMEDDVPF